ncbi:sialate O-acetylesterase [Verrucomicrobium spinosum]|uniref:sialate O-acetylesterase n=1 Tax=Verrucomicrobium spinosum TaxID=2736 RepID=UPI0009467115|nr:sialate O-acetylesterase [Verrucomicrobium spinosum]
MKGKNEVVFKDILVGEVWVCSGQSNMEWTVDRAVNPEQEIPAANHPKIRLFSVPKAVSDVPLKDIEKRPSWQVCSPETVKSFSAVGYFFGRELNKALDVPVGLINTSWGGTRAEAWTSKPALEAVPTCAAIITAWDDFLKTYNAQEARAKHEAAAAATKEKIEKIKAENAKPGATQQPVPGAPRPFENQQTTQHRPAVLFNGMVAPIVPYTVKGAIWYQGESNQPRAVQYQTLMPTLIADWRKQWGDELSFYIVQLAGFGNGRTWPQPVGAADTWAELQWAQLQTALRVKKSGLAVANDIGEEKDIHPRNKQEVGRRLALQALVKDYKKKDYQQWHQRWPHLWRRVRHREQNRGELEQRGRRSDDPGRRGAQRLHHRWGRQSVEVGQSRIVGKQIHVSSEEVKNPVAVRYAWTAWCPEANLINKEGFPASLFRSDKWELSTEGVESPFAAPKPAAPAAAPVPAVKPAEKDAPKALPKALSRSRSKSIFIPDLPRRAVCRIRDFSLAGVFHSGKTHHKIPGTFDKLWAML